MSTRSHRKDGQQTKTARKRPDTEPSIHDGMREEKQQKEGQKDSPKDHSEKARQKEKQLVAASTAAVPDGDGRQGKKARKEKRDPGVAARPDVDELTIDRKEKKRGQTLATVTESSDAPKSRSGKKKKDQDLAPEAAPERSSVSEDKGGKTKNVKRKHADCTPDDEVSNAPAGAADQDQRHQKKHRKLKFVNPKNDESLNEQASKALAYAYSQYRHPEQWKFNKAKQNWIIRNVWSSDMVVMNKSWELFDADQKNQCYWIPNEHLPLVTSYVTSVKGGIRDTLIKSCQSHLQRPSQAHPEIQPTTIVSTSPPSLFGLSPEALAKPSDSAAETKRSRAQILLEALQAT